MVKFGESCSHQLRPRRRDWITLEFQFGTNWSATEYVGDIFGSLLPSKPAAFFLDPPSLLWAFGWERVSKKVHLTAIWLVAIASNLSALDHPRQRLDAEPRRLRHQNGRAELSSFFDVVTNPFAWSQYFHTIFAAWMLGGFFARRLLVASAPQERAGSVQAFRAHRRAPFTLILVLLLGLQGHHHAQIVAEMQPAKLAAMIHWETGTHVPMYLSHGLIRPTAPTAFRPCPSSLLSLLAFNSLSAEVKGLDAFPQTTFLQVLPTFLSFRFMVACAGLFVLAIAAWWWRKDPKPSLLMKALIYVILPYLGIMAGWAWPK